MAKHLTRVIVSTIITLWVIITITFLLMHSIPGSPFVSVEGDYGADVQQQLEERYGLNEPLHVQYGLYIWNLVQGDLGVSLVRRGVEANDIIASSFPPSLKLGIISIIFSFLVGIYLGAVAALNQGKLADKIALFIATLGITTPNFVFATLFIYFFGVQWRLLPVMGLDGPQYYILPVIALSIGTLAFISRITRSSILDIVRQDYIKTARSKGMSKNTIVYKHIMRNAIIPIITMLGPLLAITLTGSFVIENIFAIPGMGNQLVNAINNRDYSIIMAMTIFFSFILVVANMIVDILYGLIDPRIKLD